MSLIDEYDDQTGGCGHGDDGTTCPRCAILARPPHRRVCFSCNHELTAADVLAMRTDRHVDGSDTPTGPRAVAHGHCAHSLRGDGRTVLI